MLCPEIKVLFPNTAQTDVATEGLRFLPLLNTLFESQCCISIGVHLQVGEHCHIPFSDLYILRPRYTTRRALSIPKCTILSHHTRGATQEDPTISWLRPSRLYLPRTLFHEASICSSMKVTNVVLEYWSKPPAPCFHSLA